MLHIVDISNEVVQTTLLLPLASFASTGLTAHVSLLWSLSCYLPVDFCSPNAGQQSCEARRAFEAHGGHSAHGNNGKAQSIFDHVDILLIMLIHVESHKKHMF